MVPLDLDAHRLPISTAPIVTSGCWHRPERAFCTRARATKIGCGRYKSVGVGSGISVTWTSRTSLARRRGVRFYEFEGTRDHCPWLAVPEAIEFQQALGWAAIRQRNDTLASHVCEVLGEQIRLPMATPAIPRCAGS